jgi:hypothetical protein
MTHDQLKALAEGMGMYQGSGVPWYRPESDVPVNLDWLTSAEGCMWILERMRDKCRVMMALEAGSSRKRMYCCVMWRDGNAHGSGECDTLPEAVALAAWKAMGGGR